MNSLNWRIRHITINDYFFIEADMPNNEDKKHYPRLEVMQDDFGDHNGYTREMRLADALLIESAPKMRDAITEVLEVLNGDGVPNLEWIKSRLGESLAKF